MNQDHWESYYRSGALVSCPLNIEPYYTMEVREAWVNFFSELSDGAHILDIGTGNGAVALIAKETATKLSRGFEIDGVDLAEIDPPRYVPGGAELLEGIRFHGGINTEALPFKKASIDAICGQYIVEYTDIAKTLAESMRVMAPGGKCQFILHHRESIVVQNAEESLKQGDLVLNESKILRKFRRYCERADKAPKRAESARRDLRAAGLQLEKAVDEARSTPLLNFIIDSLQVLYEKRSKSTRGQLLRQQADIERELKRWIQRLQDLVSAALSTDDIAEVVRMAEELEFTNVSVRPQMQGGDNLVGWCMQMSKHV